MSETNGVAYEAPVTPDTDTFDHDALIPLSELSLADLRRELAIVSSLYRDAADELATQKALAESRAIHRDLAYWNTLRNESERTRFLIQTLADDEGYREFVNGEAETRGYLEAVRAEIAIRDDGLSKRKLAQRDRELEQDAALLAFKVREFEHHEHEMAEASRHLEALRSMTAAAMGGDDDVSDVEAMLRTDAARMGRA